MWLEHKSTCPDCEHCRCSFIRPWTAECDSLICPCQESRCLRWKTHTEEQIRAKRTIKPQQTKGEDWLVHAKLSGWMCNEVWQPPGTEVYSGHMMSAFTCTRPRGCEAGLSVCLWGSCIHQSQLFLCVCQRADVRAADCLQWERGVCSQEVDERTRTGTQWIT